MYFDRKDYITMCAKYEKSLKQSKSTEVVKIV
jgi:hypothetical protein